MGYFCSHRGASIDHLYPRACHLGSKLGDGSGEIIEREDEMKQGNLEKVDQILAVVTKWGSVAWLVTLFLLIAAGVFVRFVPITSLGWADEIIELAFAWMVFLNGSKGRRQVPSWKSF